MLYMVCDCIDTQDIYDRPKHIYLLYVVEFLEEIDSLRLHERDEVRQAKTLNLAALTLYLWLAGVLHAFACERATSKLSFHRHSAR